MLMGTTKNLLVATALATLLITSGGARAEEAKAPETTSDHEALAKTYQDKAASYRKEVEWHKAMADAYAKKYPTSKGGIKDSRSVKMQKHCQQMAKTAEKLASEAEKAADFHNLRAKELQGK
jgi:hypothetical protein